VTAAALLAQKTRPQGMRPVDPRHDMADLGSLIETAFAGQLDSYGIRMVREMRSLGRAGWLGWFIGRLSLPPAAYPQGFVWEADNRLVGNASLLPVDGFPERWVLANVAVHSDYRRQGIARRLVQASIEYVGRRGGRQLLLQVRVENGGAQDLYRQLGFHQISQRTSWLARRAGWLDRPASAAQVRQRRAGEWADQYALVRRTFPEGPLWPFPCDPKLFKQGWLTRWLSPYSGEHWLWIDSGRLGGALSARPSSEGQGFRLILCADPEVEDIAGGALLAAYLKEGSHAGSQLLLDYPAGRLTGTLARFGFIKEDTLVWMAAEPPSRSWHR
jgi:ribosomal protein S18 acetylase RimI-like enzyme